MFVVYRTKITPSRVVVRYFLFSFSSFDEKIKFLEKEKSMKEILKEFISHQIRSNCFENIPLTTKRIKECYQGASNSKIFDELWMLENLGIICIKQAARSNKLFNNRKNWIKRKQSICRYVIDILKPEYFDVATVSETDWAIKAFVDTEKWDFVLQFNGIDEDIRIDLKPRKGNEKSLLMYFWERAQNNANEWCECCSNDKDENKNKHLFADSRTSINAFFERFCKELKLFFIKLEKGGYKVKFTPIIRPQSLKDEDVNEFIFFCGTESDIHYKCKFDENGKFLGWHKC